MRTVAVLVFALVSGCGSYAGPMGEDLDGTGGESVAETGGGPTVGAGGLESSGGSEVATGGDDGLGGERPGESGGANSGGSSTGGSVSTGGALLSTGGATGGSVGTGGSPPEATGGSDAGTGGSASGGSGGEVGSCGEDSGCASTPFQDGTKYCGGDRENPTCSTCAPSWCNCSQSPNWEEGSSNGGACETRQMPSYYDCSTICSMLEWDMD